MAPPPVARKKLLDASLALIREKGFSAMTVDDLCARAGVTKGAFFHHFESKEALGVEAARYWAEVTQPLFAAAPYHAKASALERVLAYVDFRSALVRGGAAEYSCVAGTMVQEVFGSHPGIRDACAETIFGHADTLVADLRDAMADAGITGTFTPESLAAHTQAVLQGGFILAKAKNDAQLALDSIAHLRRYLELLLAPSVRSNTPTKPAKRRAS